MEDRVELKRTPEKGEGVFAKKIIKRDEIVITGTIEKLLKKNQPHASQIGKNQFVLHAGLISKVNHSCDPNCGIRINKTGAHDFIAIRDISPNEEITFDYAMRNYDVDYFPEKCMCGSNICRGKITGWKDLHEERKKTYEGFIAPYLIELDSK